MSPIDIFVLLIYIAGVTVFGAYFYRRSSTSEGFTRANRRLPGWAIGLSIFGTYLSSISFLALPGKAYGANWNAFVFSLSLPFAAWVAVKWFVPLYRSTEDISAYAYLERRFGIWARLYAMSFYLLTQLVFTEPTFWVVLLYGLVINLQKFGIDQSYVQRYQTARTLADARRSIWIGALTYVPVSALFLFIGSGLFAYYGAQPELLPQSLTGAGMNDRVFPHFIVSELPAGVTGLMIAALAAAAMSSIDTSINSSATVLMTDVYRRLFKPDASEKQQMRFLRLATVVLGISGTAVAILMVSSKQVLDDWWRYAGIFSGGMLGLFLLGILSRRAAGGQAIVGMIAGLLVIVWATFSRKLDGPLANSLHAFMTTVLGTLTIFFIGVLLSRHRVRSGKNDPPLTVHDL